MVTMCGSSKNTGRTAAAVLIGGRSSRMGSPKEDIKIPGYGRTFLDKVCDEVDDCYGKCLCGRYLSVRKGQERVREGYVTVEDEYEDKGPLGGLISVLLRARKDGCEAVLLLACDMPGYDAGEIRCICDKYDGQDILFSRIEGTFVQPLASIYGVNVLGAALSLLESGDYRLRMLKEYTQNVDYYDSERKEAYRNVNTPCEAADIGKP